MDKIVNMNMNSSFPITMCERIFAQMYVFVVKINLLIYFMVGELTSSVRRYYCMDSNITEILNCSQSTVARVQVDSLV